MKPDGDPHERLLRELLHTSQTSHFTARSMVNRLEKQKRDLVDKIPYGGIYCQVSTGNGLFTRENETPLDPLYFFALHRSLIFSKTI